jgi:hypothetical protein
VILAGTVGANAAGTGGSSSSGSTTPSSTAPSSGAPAPGYGAGYGAPGGGDGGRGPDGPQGGHAGETALTGADATTVRAKALNAVPGGTVLRVETDSGDAAYEAHMKKADGTLVTVKLDKSFTVTAVEPGMGY